MHEVVFSDAIQKKNGVNTMGHCKTADRLRLSSVHHGFPLIVAGAMMIEPTESESKEECQPFHRCDEGHRGGSRDEAGDCEDRPHTDARPASRRSRRSTQAGPALEAGLPTQRSRGLSEPSNRQRPREIPFKAHIRFVARLSWLAPC